MSASPVTLWRQGELHLTSLPPLSLYVHLPWCLKKCPYCDFNSHEAQAGVAPATERRYLDALLADAEAALPQLWGRRIVSVFIGGGTPSLFSPDAIAELITGLRARFHFLPACEITLEANPGTFETDRFRAFAQAGVTRLSVGVQSFNDAHLKALGRVHDRAQALAAVAEAAEVFSTFNLDVMYALPGQTLEQLQQDVRTALSFAPPHLSLYHLTIEPNTVFASRPPVVPDDDSAADMLDALIGWTAGAGLDRYEVSAYARPGHACTHNLNYWDFGDYLGIGAGAHSKLSFAHQIRRQIRWREPQLYMDRALAGNALSSDNAVNTADLPFEFMMNALRLRHGFALTDFSERTGLPLTVLQSGLNEAQQRGWLQVDGGHVQPTPRGFDFLNDLQQVFLP